MPTGASPSKTSTWTTERVAVVELELARDALLVDEHGLANVPDAREVGGEIGVADAQGASSAAAAAVPRPVTFGEHAAAVVGHGQRERAAVLELERDVGADEVRGVGQLASASVPSMRCRPGIGNPDVAMP